MAKSKHRKLKKQRRVRQDQSFYETLPLTSTPPAATPELQAQLKNGAIVALAYAKAAQHGIRDIGRQSTNMASQAGRLSADWSFKAGLWAGRAGAWSGREISTLPTKLGSFCSTAFIYSQAAVEDAAASVGWLGRMLWHPRTRAIYVAGLAASVLIVVIVAFTLATATMAVYSKDLNSPSALLDKKKTGTVILDRNGEVLFEGYGGQHNKIMSLANMPKELRLATLAAEDPDFYKHDGFSWKGTARAAWVDITHGSKKEGGSTITQQLVKTALLTHDKTFERKYQELLLATSLEQRYSKDQILEMYLNEVYYGQGAHGAEAAAQVYFKKPAKDLTLAEAALLAGLPLGPSRLDPNVDVKAATDRRNFVLDRMAEYGYISRSDALSAKAQPINAHSRNVNIRAPHFVFYVLNQLRRQYGDELVEQGGLTVRTTLDINKQDKAQEIVRAQVTKLASHNASNGSLISIEPASGNIVTMVGSVDYNAAEFGAVNTTLAQLQPGSTFKPIAYAAAFMKGWTGASTVDDSPMRMVESNGSAYVPQNYDGTFRGPVTLRRALGNSLNIPAIKVIQFAGVDATIRLGRDLGINSLSERGHYGVSLVLGSAEAKPIEMVTAFAAFANGGNRITPRSIMKVSDRYGKDITKPVPDPPKSVLDPRHAYMITSILSDNKTREEEFGPSSPLKLSRPAAAKTGTTNDFRDNWTIGYTPQLVTAVWVGNNDHSPMRNVDGVTGAAPIWNQYMEFAHANLPVQEFAAPPGVIVSKVCGDGGLIDPGGSGIDEVFPADNPQTRRCRSVASAPSAPPPAPSASPAPESRRPQLPDLKPPKIDMPRPRDLLQPQD